jgi:hypothetical protein
MDLTRLNEVLKYGTDNTAPLLKAVTTGITERHAKSGQIDANDKTARAVLADHLDEEYPEAAPITQLIRESALGDRRYGISVRDDPYEDLYINDPPVGGLRPGGGEHLGTYGPFHAAHYQEHNGEHGLYIATREGLPKLAMWFPLKFGEISRVRDALKPSETK